VTDDVVLDPRCTTVLILETHPRLDFKRHIVDSMKKQSRIRPQSRAAFLAGLGFNRLIRAAPFEGQM
jgi:hypothetical protein